MLAEVIVTEFNKFHDSRGRFASKGGRGGIVATLNERNSLRTYHTSACFLINSTMRGKEGLSINKSGYKQEVNDLAGLISKQKTNKDLVAYRGLKVFGERDKLKKGDLFTDKAFVSTALKKDIAYKFSNKKNSKGAVFKIKVPKGTNALRVNDIKDFEHKYKFYDELIIKPGTKFKVTDKAKDGNTIVFNLEIK